MSDLTAAKLAAIEARHQRIVQVDSEIAWVWYDEDVPRLLSALREARALVEALADVAEWYHYHGDHLEGEIAVCYLCGKTDGHDRGCIAGRTEAALARWRGDKDSEGAANE